MPLSFDGSKQPGVLRHPGMREFRKNPVAVTAVQQDQPFEVNVTWQDTPLQAQAGDWLVSDESSSWPVAQQLFADTYEHQGGDQWMKSASATIMAVQLDEPFLVSTLEGEATGKAGDWLVQGAAGEAWPIPAAQFARTYAPVS